MKQPLCSRCQDARLHDGAKRLASDISMRKCCQGSGSLEKVLAGTRENTAVAKQGPPRIPHKFSSEWRAVEGGDTSCRWAPFPALFRRASWRRCFPSEEGKGALWPFTAFLLAAVCCDDVSLPWSLGARARVRGLAGRPLRVRRLLPNHVRRVDRPREWGRASAGEPQ